MKINLYTNNTTFGQGYSNPPTNFVNNNIINGNELSNFKSISEYEINKSLPYFVSIPEFNKSMVNSYGKLIDNTKIKTQLRPSSEKLKFISDDIFFDCKLIPVKELAERNIAVVTSEIDYSTLGKAGEYQRKMSFIQKKHLKIKNLKNKHFVHSNFNIHNVEKLSEEGFFFKPKDSEPLELELIQLDMIFNIFDPIVTVWDLDESFESMINGADAFYLKEFPENGSFQENIKKMLTFPAITDKNSTFNSMKCNYILSPLSEQPLILVRSSTVTLPYLTKEEAINEKNNAFLSIYEKNKESIDNCKYRPHIKFALANKAYIAAINFCEHIIDFSKKNNIGLDYESTEKLIHISIFVKRYLCEINELVSLIIYNYEKSIIIALKKSRKINKTKHELCYKDLLGQLLLLDKKFFQEAKKTHLTNGNYLTLYLHSLVYTEIIQIINNNKDKQPLLNTITQLKTQWEEISIDEANLTIINLSHTGL